MSRAHGVRPATAPRIRVLRRRGGARYEVFDPEGNVLAYAHHARSGGWVIRDAHGQDPYGKTFRTRTSCVDALFVLGYTLLGEAPTTA